MLFSALGPWVWFQHFVRGMQADDVCAFYPFRNQRRRADKRLPFHFESPKFSRAMNQCDFACIESVGDFSSTLCFVKRYYALRNSKDGVKIIGLIAIQLHSGGDLN